MLLLGASLLAPAPLLAQGKPAPNSKSLTTASVAPKAALRRIDPNRIPRPNFEVRDAPRFRWSGERFVYSVRLNGAEAMRAGVRAGSPKVHHDRPYVPVSATARSVGFFRSVYPLEDRADVYVDPASLLPYRSEKLFREAGKERSYAVDYRPDAFRAKVRKTRQDRTYNFHRHLPSNTFDMLSWVYDLRVQEVAIGERFTYHIYDGWKISRVHLEVVGREDIYTPMGWFKTWKLTFRREVVDSHARRDDQGRPTHPELKTRVHAQHEGHFYLSRDENLLPVKLTMKTSFGLSDAVLIDYTPAD